jgi:tetratricopeptide (TPR) repeat protein
MRVSRQVLLSILALLAPAARAASEDAALHFAVAQTHRFEGSYEEARASFSKAVELEPDEAYLRLEFAEFLFQLRRLPEAREQAEVARQQAPDAVAVLRLYARILLRLGERSPAALEEAREVFDELRKAAPGDVEARVTLARLLLGGSRAEEAVDVLEEALESKPRDRLIGSLLVEALEVMGNQEDAEVRLKRMLGADPGFLRPRLALAEILAQRGEHAASVELLEDAPGILEESVELQRQLTLEYYRVGRFQDSLDKGGNWLEKRPGDPMARYLRSLSLAALGRFREAEEELGQLLDENPGNLDFSLALAEVIERQGRTGEAAAMLTEQVERLEREDRSQEGLRVLLQLVDLRSRLGDWGAVLELTERLLRHDEVPERGELSLLRAQALDELERERDALQLLRRLETDSRVGNRAIAKEVEMLFGLGRKREASRKLELLSTSNDFEKLMLAAEVLHRLELYGDAILPLQKAEEINPESIEALFWLGASFERSGLHSDAESVFQRALELDAEFAPALNYLGYMWAERGENLDQAIDLVSRAVALEPNNGAYVDSLGWAYFQLGRYEEARGHLEKAARMVGEDAVIFEHLGDLYTAVGEVEQAVDIYRKALKLEGENLEEVRRKLEKLGDSL